MRYGVKTSKIKKWFLKNFSFATIIYKRAQTALTIAVEINGELAAFMSGIIKDNIFVVPRLSINDKFKRYEEHYTFDLEI